MNGLKFTCLTQFTYLTCFAPSNPLSRILEMQLKLTLIGAVLVLFSAILAHNDEEDHDHQFGEKDEHDHHADDIKDFAKKDPKDMDEQELRFYMFKQHDFDNDDRLDGIELLKNVMKHYDEKIEKYKKKRDEGLAEGDQERADKKEAKITETQERMSEENVMKNVDEYMVRFDTNNDGFIDYAEYTSVMYPEKSDKIDEQDGEKI